MIERRRARDGHAFLGCSQYPRCRGTRDVANPDDHYEHDPMFVEDFGLFHP